MQSLVSAVEKNKIRTNKEISYTKVLEERKKWVLLSCLALVDPRDLQTM